MNAFRIRSLGSLRIPRDTPTARKWCVTGLLVILLSGMTVAGTTHTPMAPAAPVQDPFPNVHWADAAPGTQAIPYEANGVVVQGLGVGTCAGGPSEGMIILYTVWWIDQGVPTATELSPQDYCTNGGGVNYYYSLLTDIRNQVVQDAPDGQLYWYGFMLDEESSYGFQPGDCVNINKWTEAITDQLESTPYLFTEIAPDEWGGTIDETVFDYAAITGTSWQAPQVYNSGDSTIVNDSCGDTGNCYQLVTATYGASSPYNNPAYAINTIFGTPWEYDWWNLWMPT